jgi:hypothetical protein
LQRIESITYDFKRFVDAESDLQLAALLPEQKVLMAFDPVFSPNEHAFTLVDHFNHWMIDHRFLRGHRQGLGNIAPFGIILRDAKVLR